ncbi:hypothetical protein [Methylocystis echinoides]|jgi:hypothetical protein|uniref:hypothetical protein n=1 Tax=Methylocystis echinoides TaxID=29468 RepID=UPI003443AED8
MDFRPSSVRDAIRAAGVTAEGSLPQRPDAGHDFDAPAWRSPVNGWPGPSVCRRFPPRLIDLERRARFARLPLDQR